MCVGGGGVGGGGGKGYSVLNALNLFLSSSVHAEKGL